MLQSIDKYKKKFPAEFCDFVFKYKRDSQVTKFRAQKARENLRNKKGAAKIKRTFEKTEGRWGKKRYGTILFQNLIDHHLIS